MALTLTAGGRSSASRPRLGGTDSPGQGSGAAVARHPHPVLGHRPDRCRLGAARGEFRRRPQPLPVRCRRRRARRRLPRASADLRLSDLTPARGVRWHTGAHCPPDLSRHSPAPFARKAGTLAGRGEGKGRGCRYRLRRTRRKGRRCAAAAGSPGGALAPRPLRGRRVAWKRGEEDGERIARPRTRPARSGAPCHGRSGCRAR